ncbi:MAG: glycosyltransferase family 2 protein [Chitinophagaceae bacterium]|nr:MAG: glycosyltransferase family 2 protein [Chitinophagaceae bacterium]
MTPRVSILIPTYNYAHYLGEAITSALNQTFQDFELIIVDDQSTDNTDEVVQAYLTDSRISYYKNRENLGLARNFNESLKYARGEYIKYLLADDLLHPALLEKFVPIMDANPNISLITSQREMFGAKNRTNALPFFHLQNGKTVITESIRKNGNWIGEPTTVMFRKSDLSVGAFNPEYTCLVDWEMWLRLLTIGDCYIVPETLSYFRVHDKQASNLILADYKYTFEDYRFYKDIQTRNVYNIDLNKVGIDELVRKRAVFCAKAMYKLLPYIHHKKQRDIIAQAFRIARREKVLLTPILKFIQR